MQASVVPVCRLSRIVTSRPATGSGTLGVTSTSASGHGPVGSAGGVGVGVGRRAVFVPLLALALPLPFLPFFLLFLSARVRGRRGVGGRLDGLVVAAAGAVARPAEQPAEAEDEQHRHGDDHETASRYTWAGRGPRVVDGMRTR